MKIEYEEIARTSVSDTRSIVVSSCNAGGYTIAQQLEVSEGDKVTSVFMKGAFQLKDLQSMYDLRDLLNLCISKIENGVIDAKDWDN